MRRGTTSKRLLNGRAGDTGVPNMGGDAGHGNQSAMRVEMDPDDGGKKAFGMQSKVCHKP